MDKLESGSEDFFEIDALPLVKSLHRQPCFVASDSPVFIKFGFEDPFDMDCFRSLR